jgi:hypothetical protein
VDQHDSVTERAFRAAKRASRAARSSLSCSPPGPSGRPNRPAGRSPDGARDQRFSPAGGPAQQHAYRSPGGRAASRRAG